jgi:hypothetical protein
MGALSRNAIILPFIPSQEIKQKYQLGNYSHDREIQEREGNP